MFHNMGFDPYGRSQVNNVENHIRRLTAKNEEQEREINAVHTKMRQMVKSAQAEIQKRDEYIAELEAALQQSQAGQQQQQQQAQQQLQERVAELEAAVQEAEAARQQAAAQADELTKQNARLTQQTEHQLAELHSHKETAKKLQDLVAAKDKEVENAVSHLVEEAEAADEQDVDMAAEEEAPQEDVKEEEEDEEEDDDDDAESMASVLSDSPKADATTVVHEQEEPLPCEAPHTPLTSSVVYSKGSKVIYHNNARNTDHPATVLQVDYSTSPPSYVIQMPDGNERCTEGSRLRPCPPAEEEPSPSPREPEQAPKTPPVQKQSRERTVTPETRPSPVKRPARKAKTPPRSDDEDDFGARAFQDPFRMFRDRNAGNDSAFMRNPFGF